MYSLKISDIVDQQNWNNNLKQSQNATFFQTYEYLNSTANQRDIPDYPIFIEIYDDKNNIKGQLGLVIFSSAKAYSSSTMEKSLNLISKLGKRASWVGGPVIHETDMNLRINILKEIMKALDSIIEKNNVIVVTGYTSPQDFLIDENYLKEFSSNNYRIENFFTFVTDLDQNLDEIWNGIHKSTLRDVKRAQRKKIIIKELTEYEQLDDYFLLSEKWKKTKGIEIKQSENFKEYFWKSIKSEIEKVFLAYEEGELVASHRLGCFNKIVYSHKLTNSYSKPTSLGGPLLTWNAIEWAKKSGLKIYDFSGGESPPDNEKDKKRYFEQWDSLLTYKRKWGGKEIPYYHFTKVKNEKRYKLFRMFAKPDWFIRNYRKNRFKRPQKNKS